MRVEPIPASAGGRKGYGKKKGKRAHAIAWADVESLNGLLLEPEGLGGLDDVDRLLPSQL